MYMLPKRVCGPIWVHNMRMRCYFCPIIVRCKYYIMMLQICNSNGDVLIHLHQWPCGSSSVIWHKTPDMKVRGLKFVIGHVAKILLSWQGLLKCLSLVYGGDRQAPPDLMNLLQRRRQMEDPSRWMTHHI